MDRESDLLSLYLFTTSVRVLFGKQKLITFFLKSTSQIVIVISTLNNLLQAKGQTQWLLSLENVFTF